MNDSASVCSDRHVVKDSWFRYMCLLSDSGSNAAWMQSSQALVMPALRLRCVKSHQRACWSCDCKDEDKIYVRVWDGVKSASEIASVSACASDQSRYEEETDHWVKNEWENVQCLLRMEVLTFRINAWVNAKFKMWTLYGVFKLVMHILGWTDVPVFLFLVSCPRLELSPFQF